MKKVISIFKHIFIPHIHNDYKPHFFREVSITSILIVVIILFSISFSSRLIVKNSDMISAVLPAVLVDLTNEDRVENGQVKLIRNPVLDTAALLKAEDMAKGQYFAHTSPQGLTPWYWFNKAGYLFSYAGENLAIDFTESQDIENAWLNSPKHKENIMSNKFTEIGIATVEGYYNGAPTIYVVQMFGKPAFTINKEVQPIKEIPTPKSTPTLATKQKTTQSESEIVKGESITSPIQTVEEKLETIVNEDKFIAVKNTAVLENSVVQPSKEKVKYSTWKERLTFMLPSYTDKMYRIFVWIVLIALILMMAIEIRRQHLKNISYGVLLMIIIVCFIYINKAIFVTSLFL